MHHLWFEEAGYLKRDGVWSDVPPLALAFMRATMIRHARTATVGGERVLSLPPKTERTVLIDFAAEERQAYERILGNAKRLYTAIAARGQRVLRT